MPEARKGQDAIQIDRSLFSFDSLLTGLFLAQCTGIALSFVLWDLVWLAVYFVLTAVLIRVCEVVSSTLGTFVSSRMKGNALSNPVQLKKFTEQSWQLVIHTFFTLWNIRILARNNFAWLKDPELCWIPSLAEQWAPASEHDASVQWELRMFYLFQLAVWLHTAVLCRFFDEVRKDYYVMMGHHVATIGLIQVSYVFRFTRVGLLVLTCHDSSDIVIDLLKMMNYLQAEFITSIVFVTNLITWAAIRLYFYPAYVIHSAYILSWPHIRSYTHDWLWWFTNGLLIFLYVLHWYWYFLFYRMLVVLLRTGKASRAAAQHIEGESQRKAEST